MSNLVIVAIPDENDRVWKVSSEKVPHLTVLYLGDADKVSNLQQIVQFVEHAANTTLGRFYLPVDRRGAMGADEADTLIFKKGRYDYKAIRDFRVQLLKDNSIRTAYDASTQFEGPWIPHLTLGYPANPAKEEKDPYPFYDVSFNKIAVWTDDYDGPEFLLKDPWDEWETMDAAPLDVAMSETSELGADYILEHYGVKGMKWGVRNSEKQSDAGTLKKWFDPEGHDLSTDIAKNIVFGTLVAPLAIPSGVRLYRGAYRGAKAKVQDVVEKHDDKKFEKVAKSQEGFVAIHNGAHEKLNGDIDKINKKYSEADLAVPAKRKQYDAEVLASMQSAYKESANQIGNKHGTKHLDVEFHNDGQDFAIHVKDGPQTPTVLTEKVKHAAIDDNDVVTFSGKIHRAPTGHILGFEFEDFKPNPVIHSDELGAEFLVFNGMMDPDEFLDHHGVKGMHWGVRKQDTAAGGNIRISNRTNRATVSRENQATIVGLALIALPLVPVIFLSPRYRAEQKAADRQNRKARGDKKYKKAIENSQKAGRVHNAAAKEINAKLPGFNNDTRWKGMTPDSPKQKAYDAAIQKELINPEYAKAAVKIYGSQSPTGRYKFEVHDGDTATLKFRDTLKEAHDAKQIGHAAGDDEEITVGFVIKRNTTGHILGFQLDNSANEMAQSAMGFDAETVEPSMAQTMELGAEFLEGLGISDESFEHYGVKGMQWGVRKPPPMAVATSAASRVPHGRKRKTKIDVEGGENHPAHEDAIAVAEVRAKLKKSGTAALSNADLQKLNKRLQLETQAAALTSSRGQKFIQRQLEQTGQQQVQLGLRSAPTVAKKVAKKAGKAAATTAVTVALI